MALAAANAGAQTRITERAGPGWIIDPAANCGTSNPFSTGRETISWSGKCLRGRLHGPGTLIWYEDGVETERDEGTFRNGELHGDAVVKLANRTVVFGNYKDGIRHGEFMVVTPDGAYVQSVYADGEQVSQRRLSRDEVKTWREARKGDQRLTTLTVDLPARSEEPEPAQPVTPAAPTQTAVAPPPVAPRSTPTISSIVAPQPAPVASAPPAVPAPSALPTPAPPTVPAQPRQSPSAVSLATTSPPMPAAAPPSAGGGLVQVVGGRGQETLVVAANIPGGIPMVPETGLGQRESFREAETITRLLGNDPGRAVPLFDGPTDPSPYRRHYAEVQLDRAAVEARFAPGSQPSLTPPGARVALVPPSERKAAARRPQAVETVALRAPSAGSAEPPVTPRLVLRPPPERPAERQATIRPSEPPTRSVAPTSAPAAPAPPPEPAAAPQRVALNLAGADIRDAAKIILGDVLKARHVIDPGVKGTVVGPTPADLPTAELVPWLRGQLQANAADLVATPEGYRIYALASAATQTGLPSLAPPAQAETVFVRGYTLERLGQHGEASKAYAEVVQSFPGTGIAAMAGERLVATQARLATPQRSAPAPDASLVGAVLCSRQDYYPNRAKWCGMVRGIEGDTVAIEVREIVYNGALAVGFRSNACTGGEFIGPTTHGKVVSVPRHCLEARW